MASVDVNPLIIGADGRPVAVDALVELRRIRPPFGPRPDAGDGRRRRAVRGAVRASGRGRRRGVERIRASSDSCRCTTCWHPGTPVPSSAPTCTARRCSACRRSPTSPRFPTAPSTSCSCARRRPPTPTLLEACAAQGGQGGVRDVRRLRRSGTAGQARRGRARRPRRRARHPARRPERPGRRQHAGRRCARRSSLPTRRPDASPSPARAATSCRAS